MNIFKALFGGRKNPADEKTHEDECFDGLKRDGISALQSRQYDAAVDLLTRAVELDSSDMECRDSLSQAYVGLGELANAYDQLQQIDEAKPGDMAVLMRMAELAQMMKNYTAMSDACEKMVLADSKNAQAYFLYGKACHALGDMTNAVAMLTRAVMLRDDFTAARELLDSIYNKEETEANAGGNINCK